MTAAKDLRTKKKVAEITGISIRFLEDLLSEGRLTTYKINSVTLIDMEEFYSIAIQIKKQKHENSNRPTSHLQTT